MGGQGQVWAEGVLPAVQGCGAEIHLRVLGGSGRECCRLCGLADMMIMAGVLKLSIWCQPACSDNWKANATGWRCPETCKCWGVKTMGRMHVTAASTSWHSSEAGHESRACDSSRYNVFGGKGMPLAAWGQMRV